MSETIGSMAKLDMRKSEDDRLYWVDTQNGGTIPEEEALKSLGIDPEVHQAPVDAVWHRQDTGEDIEVKIVGIFARNNEKKEDYLQAEGMTIGIPRSELTFKNQETAEDPEIAELRDQVKKLIAQVEKLERKNAELEAKLEGKKPKSEPKGYAGFKEEDEVGLKKDEKYAVGYKVIGFTEPDEAGERLIMIEKDGKKESVKPDELKKREEISPEEILNEVPPPEPKAHKVDYKEPLSSRVKRILMGEPEQPQYYRDDKGYFYCQDEERIYVPAADVEKKGIGVGGAAAALGALILVGFIGYELGKTGHGSSVNVTRLQKEVDDLNQQVNIFEAQNTAQHIHDRKHELQAIHGLHNQIARDHIQEMKAINNLKNQINGSGSASLHERAQDSGIYWGIRYPWDWAANKVGSFRAEGWLHTLAAKAAEHGHKVRWLTGGHGAEILQVDGHTDTSYVVNTLKQY